MSRPHHPPPAGPAGDACPGEQPLDVSVCIPVRNEKGALRKTVVEMQQALQPLDLAWEILVVDDGSSDGCIDEIIDLDVRIIAHRTSYGGGVARVTGMRFARGRVILQTDADYTYPCDQVPQILERMQHADMVIGARRRESATDWWVLRVLMKWLVKKLATMLTGRRIPDLNSGLRAYDRRIALRYDYLYPKSHSIMSTMTLAFMTEGLVVDFVDIDYRKRIGKSSFKPIIDTYNYIVNTIRTVANFDPLRLFIPVSIFLGLTGLGFATRDLLMFRALGNLSPVLLISSILVFMVAIASDQLSRISRQLAKLTNRHLVEDEDLVIVKGPGRQPPPAAEE